MDRTLREAIGEASAINVNLIKRLEELLNECL